MSAADLLPPPGGVTAVVPGPRATAARLAAALVGALGVDGPRCALVPADPMGAHGLTVATLLAATAALPAGSAREAWLRPVGELASRLARSYAELGHGERYLVGVAAARLRPHDVLLLERPAGRLAGGRTVELVAALAGEGTAVLWLERRLHLVAEIADTAWLVDGEARLGPLAPAELPADARARRLAFGGRLEAAADAGDAE